MRCKLDNGFDLKVARLKAGIRQYDLAARLGISPTQLCEIELGRRPLTPEIAEQIKQTIDSGSCVLQQREEESDVDRQG